ncbi:MAG TPA: hypothetical protein VGD14_14785 [bacterium]
MLKIILLIQFCMYFGIACASAQEAVNMSDENPSLKELPFLVSDDFKDGKPDKWIAHPEENWAVMEEESKKVFALCKAGPKRKVMAPRAYALLKDFDVTDFIFTGKIKCHQDPNILARDMVIIFHYQDSTRYYYVHFSAKSDEKHNIIALVNGKDREKINHEAAGATQAKMIDCEFHTFKVTYDSKTSKICAYLDDMATPILTAKDSTVCHGQVGVGSFDDTGCVDDVKLWGRRYISK